MLFDVILNKHEIEFYIIQTYSDILDKYRLIDFSLSQ